MAGQLGVGDTLNRLSFTKVNFDISIKKISVGYYFSVAFAQNGLLFGFGYNKNGQLGQPFSQTQISPKMIEQPLAQNITDIDVGESHCVAINIFNEPIVWGSNQVNYFLKKFGELGVFILK